LTLGEIKVEIVGARKESYDPDSRKPHVQEATLEEDLSRRDFTINAMAIGLNRTTLGNSVIGEVVDPYGGKWALQKAVIDTPLDPPKLSAKIRSGSSARYDSPAALSFHWPSACTQRS